MIAGFDRYAQIVRCFRDEDLRADRQPEFTQLDVEMAFVDEEDVLAVIERLMVRIGRELLGREIPVPLPRIAYDDAVARFGSDKPDTRFGMELTDVSQVAAGCGFGVFEKTVEGGGQVKGICAPGAAAKYSRKDLDGLTEFVKRFGAKGLAWFKVTAEGLQAPSAKYLSAEARAGLVERLDAGEGDLLLFVADTPVVVARALGELRLRLAAALDLVPADRLALCWVVDFPMFEYDAEAKRYVALHHPFTSPQAQCIEGLEKDPAGARARAYDLVLNGTEIGGGSVRIHDPALQQRVFRLLGIEAEEAEERFGFLLKALRYGAPPHGGIALGLDRIAALLQGFTSIRDVIAFPKTQRAQCLLTGAPSRVDADQLHELGIDLRGEE